MGAFFERDKGKGFVAILTSSWTICVSYFSPNARREAYEELMRNIERGLGHQTEGMIIMMDWNARNRAWGDKTTNVRGTLLEEWTNAMGLSLLNGWGAVTCRRPQGTSGVDQIWIRGGERV